MYGLDLNWPKAKTGFPTSMGPTPGLGDRVDRIARPWVIDKVLKDDVRVRFFFWPRPWLSHDARTCECSPTVQLEMGWVGGGGTRRDGYKCWLGWRLAYIVVWKSKTRR